MKAKFRLDDTFNITGRGVVLTGRITDGTINTWDIIIMGDKLISIRGIEMFQKLMKGAGNGDNVGLLVTGITKEEAGEYRKQELIVTDKIHIRHDKLDQLGI